MINFLLDADETILDFIRSSKESLAYAMRELHIPYSESDYSEYKRFNDAVWREYEQGKMTKKTLQTERFARFFDHLHIKADPLAAHTVYFEKLCRTGYLLDGAGEFLDALRERGRIFLVTNGTPAAQYGRLASVGLDGFFDGVYVSDEIGFKKPDPRFFGYLLEKEGLAKEECVVIGDSLTSDIAGANAAGLCSVWYAPSGGEPIGAKPDFIAKSYGEVLGILDKICQKNEKLRAVR